MKKGLIFTIIFMLGCALFPATESSAQENDLINYLGLENINVENSLEKPEGQFAKSRNLLRSGLTNSIMTKPYVKSGDITGKEDLGYLDIY
ncbi:hypothetical protein PWEIH_11750 [Listeria weihenstephanensis FSL R9-0317]|uniref:Uncharacterized protein n=1 Tax=Listeria weihenstephanensis TaxID=1006155 RepID=A0A1S7FUV6_9LIST|nr:hypothetical protein [Listeria weihenstephanensis]AQY51236.1 hypothetical protein UE46_09345 [Listeria weihenstephanensis]EUJ36829.1 hypothetical protein PWEIH_11750 [Listeria weihenstephanensis FSL R9-0317]